MRWKIVKVKDVAQQIRGVSYKPTDVAEIQAEGYTPIYRANNITDQGITDDDLVYVRDECVSKKQVLQTGDILIAASSGSKSVVGKAAFVEPKKQVSFGAFCKVVRPGKDVEPKYLNFYFQSPLYRRTISHLSAGANINNIRNEDIDNLDLPLPPLRVQKQIADTLDKADALRKKDQQLLQKYNELAQSIFFDMFGDPDVNPHGWKVVHLSQLYSRKKEGTKCGPFGSALKKEEYVSDGVPVWVMDNIEGDQFNRSKCLFITEQKFQQLVTYSIETGDIIISRAGTVGKMCVVEEAEGPSVISTNLIRLSLDASQIHPLFFVKLMSYFGSSIGRLKTGADGAFTHMNTGILNSLSFPLPPLYLQQRFVDVFNSLREQKRLVVATRSANLFNTLLNDRFS